MDTQNFADLVTTVTTSKELNEVSKKILGKGISKIYSYVKFKLDPYGRMDFQKQLIDALKEKQLDFFKHSLDIIQEKQLSLIKESDNNHSIIEATMDYLNNPVFIEFVKSINSKNSNWKGGSRRQEKKYIHEDSWWDIFCELMNKRHEEWRAKLLSQAMKIQVSGEGIVNSTTLWKIATLPAHSWFDLTEFLSLSGEIWVNDKYYMTAMLGGFSKISRLDYLALNGERRLVSDLDTSLTQDGLSNSESGPIILRKEDTNHFVIGDEKYKICVDPDYEDPYITDENLEDTDFHKNYFRIYGIWLSYSGEEIIQLVENVETHKESKRLFNFCMEEIQTEDGIVLNKID